MIRVIGLKRLSAEGFVPADKLTLLRDNPSVKLEIQTADGVTIERTGQIVFVSSEVDPVNNEISFRVEFDNPNRDVLPGMRLRLRVYS